jgi:hypothetical protein
MDAFERAGGGGVESQSGIRTITSDVTALYLSRKYDLEG